MLSVGTRNAEALGLRVKNVYLTERKIKIEEALASNYGKPRVRKGTKNDKVRFVPLNNDLREVILPLLEGTEPDDLVFTTYNGGPVNDLLFQLNVFKPILKKLGIPDRDLYGVDILLLHIGLKTILTL